MSRMDFSLPLQLSWVLLIYLILLHSLIAITIVLTPLHGVITGALLLVCLFSFRFYYQQFYLQTGRHKLVKLARNSENLWYLFYGDQRQDGALYLTRCLVMPELVILYFKRQRCWQCQAVWITADSVDSELFRQLRVYCRDPKTARR